MGEVALPTDPTRGKTAWPPQALAVGAKLPSMLRVVVVLLQDAMINQRLDFHE